MPSPFAPPQNGSLVWHPESRTRGSFGILSTCLLTLVACVWTAVHLNLPDHQDSDTLQHGSTLSQRVLQWFSKKKFLWKKFAWVVLGLLTPEMVAYAAWVQRVKAHQLYSDVRKELPLNSPAPWYERFRVWVKKQLGRKDKGKVRAQDEGFILEPPGLLNIIPPHQKNDHLDWQKTHAYYGAMGGYAFVVPRGTGLPFEGRLTITPSGLRFLATYAPGIIPQVSPAEIEDKSKADSVAKFIVCLQAIWFCLQCISRVAQGLSISLLELNTFGHVFCALFIYTMWWNKPLSIREPSIDQTMMDDMGHTRPFAMMGVEEPTIEEVACEIWSLLYLATQTYLGQDTPNQGRGLAKYMVPGSARIQMSWNGDHDLYRDGDRSVVPRNIPAFQPPWPRGSLQAPFVVLESPRYLDFGRCPIFPKFGAFGGPGLFSTFMRLRNSEFLRPDESEFKKNLRVGEELHGFTLISIPGSFEDEAMTCLKLTEEDIKCFKLASNALERCQNEKGLEEFYRIARHPCIATRIKNWPSSSGEAIKDAEGFNYQILAFSLASALFGGLHLLAWNSYFPSRAEMLMWKISSLAITFLGPVLIAENSVALLALLQYSSVNPVVRRLCRGLGPLVSTVSVWYATLYTFARVYIIVACFINLVHLSDSAFEVPVWSQYLPHIS